MFNGDRVSVWKDEQVLGMMVVMVAQQCERASCHQIVHLDMVKMVSFMLRVFYHNKKSTKKSVLWHNDCNH